MFFSLSPENRFTQEDEEIQITDSECFAFQNMINFIYSKDFSCGTNICDSFETLKVGDKYDLADLVILSRRAIENHVITSKNLGKVLRVIHTYEYVNIISSNPYTYITWKGLWRVLTAFVKTCQSDAGSSLKTA